MKPKHRTLLAPGRRLEPGLSPTVGGIGGCEMQEDGAFGTESIPTPEGYGILCTAG